MHSHHILCKKQTRSIMCSNIRVENSRIEISIGTTRNNQIIPKEFKNSSQPCLGNLVGAAVTSRPASLLNWRKVWRRSTVGSLGVRAAVTNRPALSLRKTCRGSPLSRLGVDRMHLRRRRLGKVDAHGGRRRYAEAQSLFIHICMTRSPRDNKKKNQKLKLPEYWKPQQHAQRA